MVKIIDTYSAGKHTALILSEKLPSFPFNKVRINGEDYLPEVVYEMDNEIGVITNQNLKGKTIEFIL